MVALVCQAVVLGWKLNVAAVLECAAHRRLFWKLVDIKLFFSPFYNRSLPFALTIVLSAVVLIDEMQL